MPAAPPRTRPAGAARSSPSAPRPGGARPARRAHPGPPPAPARGPDRARRRARAGHRSSSSSCRARRPAACRPGSTRQRTSEIALPAERGRILDRVGRAAGVQRRGPRARHQPPADRDDQGRGTRPRTSRRWPRRSRRPPAPTRPRCARTLASDKGYVVLVPLVDPDVARHAAREVPGDRGGEAGVAAVPGRGAGRERRRRRVVERHRPQAHRADGAGELAGQPARRARTGCGWSTRPRAARRSSPAAPGSSGPRRPGRTCS